MRGSLKGNVQLFGLDGTPIDLLENTPVTVIAMYIGQGQQVMYVVENEFSGGMSIPAYAVRLLDVH